MKKRPARVLHALRVMNRAGIETWLMHMLRRFNRGEIAMDFLVQTQEPGAYDEEIRSLGGRIFPCLKPSQPLRYAWNLRRILQSSGPFDILHSHNYLFSGMDLKVAAYAGVPHRIAHIHPFRDIAADRPLRGFYRALTSSWIRKHSTCVLAPSLASLDAFNEYARCSAKPGGVVLNCVDLQAYETPFDRAGARHQLGLPRNLPVIAYVARFEPHKNHLMLADVAEHLDQRGVSAHFAVTGTDGSARVAFQQRIAARNDFSVFVNQPDVASILRCADIFLFPSNEEGFGTVAIEAAAAGLPVVASSLPALTEACAPSHRRFMFSPGDHKTAALNIENILNDQALYRRLSGDAKQWAARFSVDALVEGMAGLYLGQPATKVLEAVAS